MYIMRLIAIGLIVVSVSGCDSPQDEEGSPDSYFDLGESTGYDLYTLARVVENSSAIVVANYAELTDAGQTTVATAEVASMPALTMQQLLTSYMVTEVLMSDGFVTAGMPITVGASMPFPVGTAEHQADAASEFPQVWPLDTEFILFIRRSSQDDVYGFGGGACGRILTGGSEVTCSDGDRTVLDFMSGVDRDEFIDDIKAEVANPSDTATPWPSHTPEPTPSS